MELERVPKGLGLQAQITFALRPVVSFNSAATEVEADDCVKIMEIEINWCSPAKPEAWERCPDFVYQTLPQRDELVQRV